MKVNTVIVIIVIFISLACSFRHANAATLHAGPERTASASLKGKTVMLDPGHGGEDPGAVRFGVSEARLNLAVALELERYLKLLGAGVVMTRATDSETVSLNARFELAEKVRPDVFLSLHHNDASDGFYEKKDFCNQSISFYGMIGGSGYRNELLGLAFTEVFGGLYGVRNSTVKPGYFRVIRSHDVPCILMEPFYMGDAALKRVYDDGAFIRHEAMLHLRSLIRYFSYLEDEKAINAPFELAKLSGDTFEVFIDAREEPRTGRMISGLLRCEGRSAIVNEADFAGGWHKSEFYAEKLNYPSHLIDPSFVPLYRAAIRSNVCEAKVHLTIAGGSDRKFTVSHYYKSDKGKKLAESLAAELSKATAKEFKAAGDSVYMLSATQAVTVIVNAPAGAIEGSAARLRFCNAVRRAVSGFLGRAGK